jgi:hypothetical protein
MSYAITLNPRKYMRALYTLFCYMLILCMLCCSPAEAQPASKSPYKYKIGITAIFKNEAAYLREWIEFHRLVGVEHFWLYNNSSEDNYAEVLAPYIKEGYVELFQWGNGKDNWEIFSFQTQPDAYMDAIKRARSAKQNTKWLILLDTDEFLFPVQHKKLWDCLEQYFSDCSGVCVNWQLYGTSNVAKILTGELLIEKLLYKAPQDLVRNRHYKSIVQPAHVRSCHNPHLCNYTDGHWHVDTNRDRILVNGEKVIVDKLRINHYWTRDEDYMYNVKMPRYQQWLNNAECVNKEVAELNQFYDDSILKYVPALRKQMSKSTKKPSKIR